MPAIRSSASAGGGTALATSGMVAYVDGEPAGWIAVEPRIACPKPGVAQRMVVHPAGMRHPLPAGRLNIRRAVVAGDRERLCRPSEQPRGAAIGR